MLEEEQRLNLECQSLIEEKEARLLKIQEENAKDWELLNEKRKLKSDIEAIAAEIDALNDDEEEEHNAKAASKRPSSSSQKDSSSKGKQKMIARLQTISEKDYESDEDENPHLITEDRDDMLTTQYKRALLAPHIFSAPGKHSRSEEHRARSSVFVELREALVAQDTEVLKYVPEEMKPLATALLDRATSIAVSQKDLGMVRDED